MSKCWYKLNIDVSNAINTNFNFREFVTDLDKDKWLVFDRSQEHFKNFLNKEWIVYIEQFGIKITSGGFFYKPSNYDPILEKTIHVDPGKQISAINWTLDPGIINGNINKDFEDSGVMTWFHTEEYPKKVFRRDNNIIKSYFEINVNAPDLKQIDSLKLGKDVYLVRVNAPHAVPTDEKSPRLVISIRFDETSMTNWEDVVDYFTNNDLLNK